MVIFFIVELFQCNYGLGVSVFVSFVHVLPCAVIGGGTYTLLTIGQGKPCVLVPICGPYKLSPLQDIGLYFPCNSGS